MTFMNASKDFSSIKIITDNTILEAFCWFKANGFLMNESKKQQVVFSLRDIPPCDRASNVKFLGVYLNNKLTWEEHKK